MNINVINLEPDAKVMTRKTLAKRYQILGQTDREFVIIQKMHASRKDMGAEILAVGDNSEVGVSINGIRKVILQSKADTIALIHNHLISGSAKPTEADNETFTKVQELCEVMGVEFLDSIIVAPKTWYCYHEDEEKKYDN